METIAAHPENQGKFYLQIILSYFLILALCGFFLLVYGPIEASATEYFIDHVYGNDNNSGSKSQPWRTLANVNALNATFTGGDVIHLKRGQKWNDRVTVNNVKAALAIRRSGSYNGSEINYITIADFVYETDDPNLPKPIINGNGLDCAIYLDQDFIRIKNLDITINKDIITPILSLLLLDSSDEDTSENTIGSTSSSLALPPISSESPPPAPTPKRSYLPPPCRIIPALLPTYVDPPPFPPVLPSASSSPEIPEGFYLTPEGELIPIPVTSSALTSDPSPPVLLETETAVDTGVKGKGIRIEPSGNNYTVENNIVIDACDVHDFSASGISIGSNRGYVTVKGDIVGENRTSNIYNNHENGIEVFDNFGNNNYITIDKCSVNNNTLHGIYLAGNYAVISNSLIYSNGNELSIYQGNPVSSHNIYLLGDHAHLDNNTIKWSGEGGNGDGFRYAGSYLLFENNTVRDNWRHGLAFWNQKVNNQAVNYVSNTISYNDIYVTQNLQSDNNKAIAISREWSDCGWFYDTQIINHNTIYGYNDMARGIYLQGCSGGYYNGATYQAVTIDQTEFWDISGYQIELNQDNHPAFNSYFTSSNNDFWNSSAPVKFCADFDGPAYDYISFCVWKTLGAGYDNVGSIDHSGSCP